MDGSSSHAASATPRRPWTHRLALGASLTVVVVAPELAAWHGLLGFARDVLRLTGAWALLVPLMFGIAAFYCALLAVRDVTAGDSAVVERALTWVYAAAGAGFNWFYGTSSGNAAAALFFAGASLSAALLWDRTLRAWRRDELRAAGALERPLPRFRLLRWLVAPRETWRAWSLAVREGITSPAEALEWTRDLEIARQKSAQASIHADDQASSFPRVDALAAGGEPAPAPELAGKSKSKVIVDRLIELGVDFDRATRDEEYAKSIRAMVPAATDWAAAQGVSMERGRGYDAVRREINRRQADHASERRLSVVSGGEQR